MPEKDLKVFIGPGEIANIGAILASALREKGIRVTVVRFGMPPFSVGMKYDKVLNFQGLNKLQKIFKYLYLFLKFFPRYNVYIFLAGVSLLPYNVDLPILKLFHKKTVMWFVGSDIRHYESVEAAIRKMGIKYRQSEDRRENQDRVRRKKRMIHRVEKFVDYIVAGSSYSHLLTRKHYTLFAPIDIHDITYNNAPNTRSVLVHAPSRAERKGTSYILEAMERLKSEGYDFEFRLFQNTSNVKVRETLSNADISVDQLFSTCPGMFAIESMAAGCAVLSGNIAEFSGFPPDLPVIHTDPDNVYQNMKMLLENPELRRELGEKGRRYVEKYHDYRKIADEFLKLIAQDRRM